MGVSSQDPSPDVVAPEDDDHIEAEKPIAPGLARGGFRRLTQAQYANAMVYLFGEPVEMPADFEPDFTSSNKDFEYRTELSYTGKTAAEGVSLYARSADQITGRIFSDPRWRVEVVGCEPRDSNDPCVAHYLRRLMSRAFSRAIEDQELARYRAIVASTESDLGVWEAIRFATSGVIQSPSLLFRVQVGELREDGTRRFRGREVADRLALLLWNSIPDEALVKAAEAGDLSEPEQVRAQAERLLRDPRAREGVRAFFLEWLGLESLASLSKDKQVYPEHSATLGQSMLSEISHYFDHVVFDQPGDLFELFASREIYINEELRLIYGAGHFDPIPEGEWRWEKVPDDWHRRGLLTTPGVMAHYSGRHRDVTHTARSLCA